MAVVFDAFEFYKKITTNQSKVNNLQIGRIVCFDYGTRKLGIACGDLTNCIAFPKEVIVNNWRDADVLQHEIIEQCVKYNTKHIVIGLPKKNNNTLDEKCYFIIEVANKICKVDEMFQVLLFDERFTTKQSLAIRKQSVIIKGNVKKNKKEKTNSCYDDASSASIILQDVLDLISSYNLDNNY